MAFISVPPALSAMRFLPQALAGGAPCALRSFGLRRLSFWFTLRSLGVGGPQFLHRHAHGPGNLLLDRPRRPLTVDHIRHPDLVDTALSRDRAVRNSVASHYASDFFGSFFHGKLNFIFLEC